MDNIDLKKALEYLCLNAQRTIPLSDANTYNAAVKAMGECIDFKLAQDAIAADKAKAPAVAEAVPV